MIGVFEERQGLLATLGGFGFVAQPLDRALENAALDRIVIDDEDELGHEIGYSTQQGATVRGGCDRSRTRIGQAATHGLQTGPECPRAVNASLHFGMTARLFCAGSPRS